MPTGDMFTVLSLEFVCPFDNAQDAFVGLLTHPCIGGLGPFGME